MKNGRKIWVKILTILTLLFGTVSLLQTDFTIAKTAAKIWVLHDNMSFYNEQSIKTNQMTKDYERDKERKEEIRNSENPVERIFANQNFVGKFVLLVFAVGSIVLIPYMWVDLIRSAINRTTRKIKRTSDV